MSECDELDRQVAGFVLDDPHSFARLRAMKRVAPCITKGLRKSVAAADWEMFERYVIAAHSHPDPAMTKILSDVLLARNEHINNEDIVEVLVSIADPEAVPALESTLWWQPSRDEYHGLGVKCVWALSAIGTEAAMAVLRDAMEVGPVEIREWAASELKRPR